MWPVYNNKVGEVFSDLIQSYSIHTKFLLTLCLVFGILDNVAFTSDVMCWFCHLHILIPPTGYVAEAVASKYPHSTLNSTATCSSHSGTG